MTLPHFFDPILNAKDMLMLKFLNTDRIVENCEAVARYATTSGSLRCRYAQAQRRLLDIPLIVEPHVPVATFGRPEWIRFLGRRKVIAPESLEQVGSFSSNLRFEIQEQLEAMRYLISSHTPEALEMLDLLVSEIVVLNMEKPTAGSHSAALAMIWINPKREWTPSYYAETVVHEMLHQVLFLEDMVNGLMQDMDLLEREDTRAYSAVRKTSRYFDSAFHAAFVAAGMTSYYRSVMHAGFAGQAEKIFELVEHGQLAVKDLQSVALRQRGNGRPILTPRGEELLDAMDEFFHTVNVDAPGLPIAA